MANDQVFHDDRMETRCVLPSEIHDRLANAMFVFIIILGPPVPLF